MTLRDGARISLWQDTVKTFRPKSILRSAAYDVAIAGGGISGLSLALLLQKSGKKCVVMEAQTLGFGTTGGTTAHLNTLMDTPYTTIIRNFGEANAKLVAKAAKEAIDLIKGNIAEHKIDCGFEEVSAFLFSQTSDQSKELEKIHEACNTVGVRAEFRDKIPVPIPYKKAMEVSGQAKFHPLRYLFGLAEAFEKEGGVIIENCRVTGMHSKDFVTVETTMENIYASALVFATHIPIGVNVLHLRCPAYRSYAMAVELNDEKYPKDLAYDMYDPYHYYRTQNIDGKNYLVVGGEDHKTGEEPNTNGNFLRLESHLRSFFNVKQIVHRWSSQYFEPVDGLPYIGNLPGHGSKIYVATGYGGNGMTYSHVAARLLKEIILKGESRDQHLFTPARIKPVAGFTEFVKHNADVVKQFAGKWFGTKTLEDLAALAPGEAKVVKYEEQSIALYKDEKGRLHAVSPDCTHLKCSVKWNAAEMSWDCPCHGARYTVDGMVLTGPASQDLEPIEVRDLVKNE